MVPTSHLDLDLPISFFRLLCTGAIEWLNCGISKSDPSSGWTPPTILMTDLIYKSLDAYVATTFKACKPFISIFNSVANTTGIPAIFIVAFAMQESSCDPNSFGDDGDTYGLMQITSEKCHDAPNGNCADSEFNVKLELNISLRN